MPVPRSSQTGPAARGSLDVEYRLEARGKNVEHLFQRGNGLGTASQGEAAHDGVRGGTGHRLGQPGRSHEQRVVYEDGYTVAGDPDVHLDAVGAEPDCQPDSCSAVLRSVAWAGAMGDHPRAEGRMSSQRGPPEPGGC